LTDALTYGNLGGETLMNKKVKNETVEDIVPYWNILDGWENLPFSKKCEYYWKYQYDTNGRVMPTVRDDEDGSK